MFYCFDCCFQHQVSCYHSSLKAFLTLFKGGTIKTSLNLPAQSFYQSRKTLLDLCDRASIKQVIFFCGKHLVIWSAGITRANQIRLLFRKRASMRWLDARLYR